MDVRYQRGLSLARDKRIKHIVDSKWHVPSEEVGSSAGYVVDIEAATCSCPDFETRQARCKHVWAVALRPASDSAAADSQKCEPPGEVRVSYSQNWPAYNRAQTTEKAQVGTLLQALCDGIVQPPQQCGRPRLRLADLVHAATMKVFTGLSGRRASTDVRRCAEDGLISHAPHYNSIHNLVEREDVTHLLKVLVAESAAPLKEIEDKLAVDATGFATSTYARWFDQRNGRQVKQCVWMKCHAMVGVITNVITAVEVTAGTEHDSPYLQPLVKEAVKRFSPREISADKGYLSDANLRAIEDVGAVPYIPFKINSKPDGSAIWRRMYHLFALHRERFLRSYHRRSNVEATFSMLKRKFGASVRAKLPISQMNEVLLKCLCHNLSVLVHANEELGVSSEFWMDGGSASLGEVRP